MFDWIVEKELKMLVIVSGGTTKSVALGRLK